jgi:hypothetical protein
MQLLSQPSMRIVRLLRLRKGSLASSYGQLFISFGISCLFHQAQMFNVTRRDMVELNFFMSQPFAIVAEDLVHWVWKNVHGPTNSGRLEKAVGYAWTFAWFSFSLRLYVSGLVEARVMKDWLFGYSPSQTGPGWSSPTAFNVNAPFAPLQACAQSNAILFLSYV